MVELFRRKKSYRTIIRSVGALRRKNHVNSMATGRKEHCRQKTGRGTRSASRPETGAQPTVQDELMAASGSELRVLGGELFEHGVVEVVEGVEADAEYDGEGGPEDPGEKVAVYYVGVLAALLPGAYVAEGHAPALLHQPLHVGQLLPQLVHRVRDVVQALAVAR